MPGKASQVVPQPQAETTETCSFWCLHADWVRKFPGKKLPFFQELRNKHPEALVQVTISYAQVVTGALVEDYLSVSHRWMEPNDPDPDGEQLKAIKAFLDSDSGKKIKRVWIDSACMPQDHPKGSRSQEDTAAFKMMLSNVNMLYLGMTVLILLDLSYVSRFWTQFEAWLSMQFAMPDGLKPAVGTANVRHHIMCIQNAAEQAEHQARGLIGIWADKTPLQAHDFLSKPDVTVTNQSDKEGQLPKIKALGETVQRAYEAVDVQLKERIAGSAHEAARAKAALEAFESENGVKAGDDHPLQKVATQTEREAEAACAAKEMHAQAIAHGVVPVVMERDIEQRGLLFQGPFKDHCRDSYLGRNCFICEWETV